MAIINPRFGAFGIGEESTAGTAVSRTNWRPAIRMNPQLATNSSDYQDLHRSGAGSPTRNSIDNRTFADRLEWLDSYTRNGMLWKHLIGSVSTTGPSGSDYTHTYDPSTLPTGLTIEGIRGNAAESELAAGCQFADWSWGTSVSSRRAVVSANVWGIDSTRPTKGSPSYGATDDPVLHHHIGTVSWNSLNPKPSAVQITGKNGLERVWTDAVTCEGFTESGDRMYGAVLTIYDRDTTAYFDAFKAQTESNLVIPYSNGSLSFQWTLKNARIVSISEPIQSGKALTRQITFAPRATSSVEALELEIVNENSSGTAN